jgi:chemotaxis protein MotB
MPVEHVQEGSAGQAARILKSPYRRLISPPRPSQDSDSIWLLTLSDLLTLLLVFFVFFLTVRTAETHKETRTQTTAIALPVNQEQFPHRPDKDISRSERASAVRELNSMDGISVQDVRGEILITLNERVTFRPGEAEVLPASEPVLETISRIIKDTPSFSVEIDGHTDNTPISTRLYPSNWELSVARATAVLRHFINTCGIDPSRFSVKGNADLRPLVPNDTHEHRAENRRVEIRLREVTTH